jgi:hypothetical protein
MAEFRSYRYTRFVKDEISFSITVLFISIHFLRLELHSKNELELAPLRLRTPEHGSGVTAGGIALLHRG